MKTPIQKEEQAMSDMPDVIWAGVDDPDRSYYDLHFWVADQRDLLFLNGSETEYHKAPLWISVDDAELKDREFWDIAVEDGDPVAYTWRGCWWSEKAQCFIDHDGYENDPDNCHKITEILAVRKCLPSYEESRMPVPEVK